MSLHLAESSGKNSISNGECPDVSLPESGVSSIVKPTLANDISMRPALYSSPGSKVASSDPREPTGTGAEDDAPLRYLLTTPVPIRRVFPICRKPSY